jgi:hypothetical protein
MKRPTGLLLAALVAWPCFGAASVSFKEEPGKIQVLVAGKPFTTLHYGSDLDKPFLHPLRTASGILVTRGNPVDPAPGETTDHPHHRGLWWAHGRTNGVDFWTNGKNTGRYRLKSAPKLDSQRGSIRLDLEMVTPANQILGSLVEEYTFSANGDNRIVDVWVQILADREGDILLGDTREGVMGFRVADALTEPNGATLLNSEGGVGETEIWGRRARWVDYSGKINGTAVGVAMFDHPSNPKHPTFWMARGYGLLAANAFGEREFTGDEKRDGSLTIPRGGKLEFRYRLVIHPGDAKAAGIEALFAQYAKR